MNNKISTLPVEDITQDNYKEKEYEHEIEEFHGSLLSVYMGDFTICRKGLSNKKVFSQTGLTD